MRTAFAIVDELVAGTREATDAKRLVDGTLGGVEVEVVTEDFVAPARGRPAAWA